MRELIIFIGGILIMGLAIGVSCFLTLGFIQILLVTLRNNFYTQESTT